MDPAKVHEPQLPSVLEGLSVRLKAIQAWCYDRGISQYAGFFCGANPDLKGHEVRMRFVWRDHRPLASEDAQWIEGCELVINKLNNAA